MKESNFQFSNPSIIYVKFIENNNFDNKQGKEIEIETKIQVKNSKINDREAIVNVVIIIGKENDYTPFLMETEVSANFRWNESMDENKVELFLNQNAPALLISYARPIISMITNSSHYPAYDLPFINLAEENHYKG